MFNENILAELIIVLLVIAIPFILIKYRHETRNTIEEDIRNLKTRQNSLNNSHINQLNSDDRYKTNKPKNNMYSSEDRSRMIKNIRSMYKQGIISENEYKEQLNKIKAENI